MPWVGSTRLEVDALAPAGEKVAVDQRFELVVSASDNHAPEAGLGSAAPVRIRIITADELLRRLQDRLARARLDAEKLAELQREKQQRVLELLAAAGDSGAAEELALHTAALGQRRVEAEATTLTRDLAQTTQELLYARLDDKSGPALAFLEGALAATDDAGFHPEVWQSLAAASARGELGTAGFSANLVRLVVEALAISSESAALAARELERAEKASAAEEVAQALEAAYAQQSESLARIDVLLASLAEWDNFQNVLALTRDILSRQKALRERTQHYAKEGER